MRRKSTKLEISPTVLKALRESSGRSIQEIARILNTTEERIKNVEKGEDFFTLKEIKKLSNIYNRPLAAFFTKEIPKIPTIPDYRINRERKLTPEVYLAMRRAYYLASKILELSNEKSKIPNFPKDIKPEELAKRFRNYLKVDLLKSEKPEQILDYYREILEKKLSILIIEYPLKADDVRAFSLALDISIIVLNEQDGPTIKLFSLFHEVCHLLKRSSAICSIEPGDKRQPKVEFYCDSFAAEFLVPLDDLKEEILKTGVNDRGVSRLSKIYGVSKQVIMLRLLKLGYVDSNRYQRFKEKFDKEKLEKKKFGRRNWEKVYLRRVGNFAIQKVSNAYVGGDITFLESVEILDLKTKYAEKFIT